MEFRFTKHSLERLFERGISPIECEEAFQKGDVIESYNDDKPFPSELRIAKVTGRYLHLVTAKDGSNVHVITAYEPDPTRWDKNFKERKK
jgi:hypothetical protein